MVDPLDHTKLYIFLFLLLTLDVKRQAPPHSLRWYFNTGSAYTAVRLVVQWTNGVVAMNLTICHFTT